LDALRPRRPVGQQQQRRGAQALRVEVVFGDPHRLHADLLDLLHQGGALLEKSGDGLVRGGLHVQHHADLRQGGAGMAGQYLVG
jgi:hypothetical protein